MRQTAATKRNWIGATLAVMVAALGVSCGGGTVTSAHVTGASGTQSFTTLTVNASMVDFGNVAVGGSKTSSVMLTNSARSGGKDITVSQVAASGTGFSVKAAALPILLPPGESSSVAIVFTPKSAGPVSGNLAITQAGATAPSTVTLSGAAVGAGQLSVSPNSLSFGNVAVGSSATKTGSLTAGSTSVTVASADWSGSGYSVSGISFPLTVAAGQSIPFSVTFTPTAAGSSPGSVSFKSDSASSPATQDLSGAGTQTQSQNSTAASIDLIWDPSSSTIIGYNVYRATNGTYSRLNPAPIIATTFTDNSVEGGATYTYVTTAVNAHGNESPYSNPVTTTIPGE